MVDDSNPKLAETGFYKTVHDLIESAAVQFDLFIGSINIFGKDQQNQYSYARSTLLTLYYTVILPHNFNNPDAKDVKGFRDSWDSLNKEYGDGFESGTKIEWSFNEDNKEIKEETVKRYSLIMNYVNTLGIAQLKQRGETWEDAELEVMMEALK